MKLEHEEVEIKDESVKVKDEVAEVKHEEWPEEHLSKKRKKRRPRGGVGRGPRSTPQVETLQGNYTSPDGNLKIMCAPGDSITITRWKGKGGSTNEVFHKNGTLVAHRTSYSYSVTRSYSMLEEMA